MFRNTENRSSGSLVQCLAKNYKNDSIASVDMDVVGVMAAYSDQFCVCVCNSLFRNAFLNSEIHTHTHTHTQNRSEYAAITPTIVSFLSFLAKHCIRLPDDGSSVIRNMSEHF